MSTVGSRLSGRLAAARKNERDELLALAEGVPDLIRLGRGDPDLPTPEYIVDAAIEAMRSGFTHYTHWAGSKDLRIEIARKLREENALDYTADSEVMVSTGVQEAIYLTFQALVEPGDEVLIGDPFYTSYATAVALSGGKLVRIATRQSEGHVLQPEAIEAAITPKSKMLIIVSPCNPTGAVIPGPVLERIAEVAQRHGLIVVSDEIYEKLVFDGAKHTSIASFPGMKERSVVLNGFSKAYAMTGWRVGYMAAPGDFVQRCGTLKHSLTIAPNQISQRAALAALRGGARSIEAMVAEYDARRRVAFPMLRDMGLSFSYPGGTYYVLVDITSTGQTSLGFCRDVLLQAHVQLFPGTIYGAAEGHIRVSLLAPCVVLAEALSRIAKVVKSYGR